MNLSRRSFAAGLVGFVACAPAIVRASSLMPVKPIRPWLGLKELWVMENNPSLGSWADDGGFVVPQEYAKEVLKILWGSFPGSILAGDPVTHIRMP